MRLGDLIRERLAAIGQHPSDLRRELARAGVIVTRQGVHGWLTGARMPDATTVATLLDVLAVPMDARRKWAEAAGYGEVFDAVYPPDADRKAS